ncbi:GntR family transcriptional regulator [Desmospora activa]|uniref:GntR family transcriptional regulator n=1 Tax=Desmospora activa DSM 45169 TaxID=1121389 RepID=A0A2T4Z0H5_9BACL|nr:GntR family transcriptional regulator [Desmospora activa]PTM53225.1 GntR family transcriptional regulator [Desmospora activa DSM 45169]
MRILISNQSKEPIYEQIKTQIKEKILNDELKEGDALPSMRKLAKDLRISLITTKRAYVELENEGFITSFVGKGSFVASQNTELLREKRLNLIEEQLAQVVEESKRADLSLAELKEILEMLFEEDK